MSTVAHEKIPIGGNIKFARNYRRLSQTELGNALGVTRAAVALWETNKRTPDEATVKRIADSLRVRPEWLRAGVDPMLTRIERRKDSEKECARSLSETQERIDSINSILKNDTGTDPKYLKALEYELIRAKRMAELETQRLMEIQDEISLLEWANLQSDSNEILNLDLSEIEKIKIRRNADQTNKIIQKQNNEQIQVPDANTSSRRILISVLRDTLEILDDRLDTLSSESIAEMIQSLRLCLGISHRK